MLEESNARKITANKFFSSSQYSQAIGEYDKALSSCPNYLEYEIAVLKSNIAACHLKLEDWKAAVESATAALDALDRLFPKEKKEEDEAGKDGDVVEIEGEGTEAEEEELKKLEMSDQRRDDILRIRSKALMRRAKAKSEQGGWGNLQGAEEDYKVLAQLTTLPPQDMKIVQAALRSLPPRISTAKEKEMGRYDGKAEGIGKRYTETFRATFEDMARNWADLSPLLAAKGYCVYSLNYGFTPGGGYATGPIQDSAKQLRTFVNKVLRHTGAKKVSIVGHSQGGMMPRYYIKFLGGTKKVDDLIGLVPSNHGTKGIAGLDTPSSGAGFASCVACRQQMSGSAFLKKLNRGDETPGRVSYTVVTTRNDEVVVPYTSAFLSGPRKQVRNITIQRYYPADQVDHQGITYDPNAFNFAYDALAHEGPAKPSRAVALVK